MIQTFRVLDVFPDTECLLSKLGRNSKSVHPFFTNYYVFAVWQLMCLYEVHFSSIITVQLVDQTLYITTATSIHLCTREKGIQLLNWNVIRRC